MAQLSPTAAELVMDVRVLVPDDAPVFGPERNEYIFTDEQYVRFLKLGGGSALRAAGLAMIAVGNSEALISKVIKSQDLQTDGSKVQKEWRTAGLAYINSADIADRTEDRFDGFDLIDFNPNAGKRSPELTEGLWQL